MLDDNDALTKARASYAYAPFSLNRADPVEAADAVLWGQPVMVQGPTASEAPTFSAYSSWELDRYHCGLLRSEVAEDVLLGVASVTFWGFAQGRGGRYTTARALARAGAVAGLGKRGADSPSVIRQKMRTIASLLDGGDRQRAVLETMTLKHHGLAFGSKLLAFMSPDTNCVYDEVISLRLQSSDDPRLSKLHVSTAGQHRLSEKAAAYEGWAMLCSGKAQELNGEGMRWKDWDGVERPWRAVDVERAFFGLGRP